MSHLKFTLILLATVFVGASPVFAQSDDPASVLKQLNDGDLKVDDVFYSLDEDGDKSITAAEATGPWSSWVSSGDRNDDGALSISEFRTYVLSEVERIQNPTADPRSFGWMMTYVVVGLIVLLVVMFEQFFGYFSISFQTFNNLHNLVITSLFATFSIFHINDVSIFKCLISLFIKCFFP